MGMPLEGLRLPVLILHVVLVHGADVAMGEDPPLAYRTSPGNVPTIPLCTTVLSKGRSTQLGQTGGDLPGEACLNNGTSSGFRFVISGSSEAYFFRNGKCPNWVL